jgi:hypothetical protein
MNNKKIRAEENKKVTSLFYQKASTACREFTAWFKKFGITCV